MNYLQVILISYLLIFSFSISAKESSNKKIVESYRFEQNKNYKLAIQRMLQVSEKKYFYNLRLGWLFYLSKQYRNSFSFYNEALKFHYKSISAALGASYAHTALGNFNDAAILLEKSYKVNSGNKIIGLRLVSIYFKLFSWKKSIKVLNVLYESFPENIAVLESLIIAHKNIKDLKKEKYFSQKLLLVHPLNTKAIESLVESK